MTTPPIRRSSHESSAAAKARTRSIDAQHGGSARRGAARAQPVVSWRVGEGGLALSSTPLQRVWSSQKSINLVYVLRQDGSVSTLFSQTSWWSRLHAVMLVGSSATSEWLTQGLIHPCRAQFTGEASLRSQATCNVALPAQAPGGLLSQHYTLEKRRSTPQASPARRAVRSAPPRRRRRRRRLPLLMPTANTQRFAALSLAGEPGDPGRPRAQEGSARAGTQVRSRGAWR